MNAPKLHLVRTRDDAIEDALRTLTEIMGDPNETPERRFNAQLAHKHLHACRSPETVRRLEIEQGLR